MGDVEALSFDTGVSGFYSLRLSIVCMALCSTFRYIYIYSNFSISHFFCSLSEYIHHPHVWCVRPSRKHGWIPGGSVKVRQSINQAISLSLFSESGAQYCVDSAHPLVLMRCVLFLYYASLIRAYHVDDIFLITAYRFIFFFSRVRCTLPSACSASNALEHGKYIVFPSLLIRWFRFHGRFFIRGYRVCLNYFLIKLHTTVCL